MAHLHLVFPTTILVIILCLPMTMSMGGIPVLDVYGNPLEVGTPYYIRTAVSQVGIGGGVVMASKPNQPQCPEYAGHLSVGFKNESPVMFYPSQNENSILVSSDLNIVFNATSSACSQGTWKLTPDANSDKVFISTAGVLGNPTADTLFKIEDDFVQGLYQLTYCPSGSGTAPSIMCGVVMTIDFTEDFELGWLGLAPSRDSYFAALSFIKA